MKFQMAFAAPFFLWDFPFDVFCFLWHPCSSKISFWDLVFCSYIHTLLLRCHAFWLLRDFRMRLHGLWAIRDFMGWPYVGNFLMRFPVFACIDFLLRFPYEKSSCFLLHDLLMRKSCFWAAMRFPYEMSCFRARIWDLRRRVHALCCIIR